MTATTSFTVVALSCSLMACHAPDTGAPDTGAPDTGDSATAASHAGMPRLDPADGHFDGTIRQRLSAGSYTYLRVDDTWVVTLGKGAPTGASVHVVNMGVRSDFHSRRLDRSFDRLVFGIIRQQESS